MRKYVQRFVSTERAIKNVRQVASNMIQLARSASFFADSVQLLEIDTRGKENVKKQKVFIIQLKPEIVKVREKQACGFRVGLGGV